MYYRRRMYNYFTINSIKRIILGTSFFLLPLLIFLCYLTDHFYDGQRGYSSFNESGINKFLINTSGCKIPHVDPFNKEVLPFVKIEEYENCSILPLLTYIEKSDGVVSLKVNRSLISLYSSLNIKCCYSNISRNGDQDVSYSSCTPFYFKVNITHGFLQVICTNLFRIVYQNVHVTIIPENDYKNVSSKSNGMAQKFDIFLLGFDSVSNLNLQRTMPKTYMFLEKYYINLKGYNKIAENTFPNLMAILTGRNMSTLDTICERNQRFDCCDIIWKKYKENGYITAYAEDEPSYSTFNYLMPGFGEPPTDFYLRPYFLSAYKLPVTYKYYMGVCSGPENSGERVLSTANDFINTFQNVSTFGMFWINSFSHGNVNYPVTMDKTILHFLSNSRTQESLENAITVVFSDHGFRFGGFRLTYTGWLEERLPFIYFKFPKTFQKTYPRYYENFIFNAKYRLTTPFDFHMTLQHILKLSNNSFKIQPSLGCPNCQSLFKKIPEDRSCRDVNIEQHWCTCGGFTRISPKKQEVIEVAQFIINEINNFTQSFPQEGHLCSTYQIQKVILAGMTKTIFEKNKYNKTYVIIVETYPFARFEATVQNDKSDHKRFLLLGDISRLTTYGSNSYCVKKDNLKKFCFCDDWTTKIKTGICYFFNCVVD